MGISDTNEDRLKALIDAYRCNQATATHQDRAERERQIARLVNKLGLAGWGGTMQKWFAEQFGGSGYEYGQRQRILSGAREAAELLWRSIDAGMPYGTAVNVLTSAQRRANKKDPVSLRKAIAEEIRLVSVRKGYGSVAEDSTAQAPPVPTPAEQAVATERGTWANLKRQVARYAVERMPSVPEADRARALEDLESDLASHQARWRRLEQRGGEAEQRLTRAHLRDALRTLHMDPPDITPKLDAVRRGEALEQFLQKARRQQRNLARLYHPDTRGCEDMRPQYEAVHQAYQTIEQYVQQMQKTIPSEAESAAKEPYLRVVPGGKQGQ